MRQLIFSVYDSKANAFLQPFFCVNRAVALRSFMQAAQDERHDFHRFAADFALFEIGEWDPVSGKFECFEKFENLGLASQYLEVR